MTTRLDELVMDPAPQAAATTGSARKLVVVIPAYNEAANLSRQLPLLETALEHTGCPWRMIVVDDGSSDDTAAVIAPLQARLPLTVIRHERNRGCGQAFRSGLTAALQDVHDEDVVITIEADNTQSVRAIRAMLQKLEDGFEVVVGSYFAPGGMLIGAPFVRYACSWVSNWLYRLVFPIRGVSCYTGFFRAYRGAVLKRARQQFGESWLEGEGFTVMAGFLLKLRRLPVFIAEVPLIVRFDRRMGSSKMKILSTIAEHLRVMAREIGQRNLF